VSAVKRDTGQPIAVYPWHCLVPFLAASSTQAVMQRQQQQQQQQPHPAETLLTTQTHIVTAPAAASTVTGLY